MRLKVSLKASLLGAFAVLALICVAQGGYTAIRLLTIRASVTEVAMDWLPSVVAINNIRASAADVRIKQLRMLAMSGSQGERDEIERKLTTALAAVAAARKVYEPLIANPEERGYYQDFAKNWELYEVLSRDVLRAAIGGRIAEALAMLGDPESIKVFNGATDCLEKDVALNERGAQRDANLAMNEVDAAAFAAYVAIVLSLAAAAAATAFGFLHISRPIQAMTGAMTVLAGGDAAFEVPHRHRRDEIGAMAAAVQVFKDNLVHTRELEAETAQARLAAEEQRKAGMRQMADSFEAAVGGIIGLVSASATELQATAQTMSATATETASRSTTVAAAAEEAASNVNTVAAAAEELGSSVAEIGRQVDGSAELARAAVTEANQTSDLVQELSGAVSRIGDVVGMISGIAAQTNLLALNATIEAARAGEAGRGFAVVASEVKELAGQTAKATEEIAGQIANIQASTGQAVSAIGGITTHIAEISGVATSIAAAVEEQGAATQEIVRNVSQASAGTSEVTGNIAGVAGAADETGTAATQVLGAASELSRHSERLSEEVGRFLATVRAA